MYNEAIDFSNKIVSNEDLYRLFEAINNNYNELKKIYEKEVIENERYESAYQKWTLKGFSGSIHTTVNFYDSASISFDDYASFISIYNERLSDIKYIHFSFRLYYYSQDGEYISQGVSLDVYEDKINVDFNIKTSDDKMREIYNLIQEIKNNSPERYDRTIKKRGFIISKCGVSVGLVFSIIICTVLIIVESIRNIYASGYVVYPLATLFLGFALGIALFSNLYRSLYKTIIPNQKYVGYNSSSNKSIYKDDVENYINKCEVTIGHNINNIKIREVILEKEKMSTKMIFIELLVILIISIVVLFMGNPV